MMRLGRNLIQRTANYFKYRFVARAVILMYHRVADVPLDPQLLCVTPQHFDEQLQILHRYAHPISLQELCSALQTDRLSRGAVVITFDDGYFDNLRNAKPLLERHGIPATMFIPAGQIGCPHEFWWDELERLFLQPGTLPAAPPSNLNGHKYDRDILEALEYPEADYERHRDWNIEQPTDPTPRHRLYHSTYGDLHSMNESNRQRTMQELREWMNQDAESRPTHRTLTVEELLQLAQGGLIEVGAHTMTHSALAALPRAGQKAEIVQSKACLEELLSHPVVSFSYPHGAYTDETVSLLQEARFTCACSSDTAVIASGADPFRLPRFSMRDWNGEEFYRWLKGLIPI